MCKSVWLVRGFEGLLLFPRVLLTGLLAHSTSLSSVLQHLHSNHSTRKGDKPADGAGC